MKKLGPKMRAFVVLAIFFTSSFMLLTGAVLIKPNVCIGITCDPTISVVNVSWFGQLLQKTAYNTLINQAKAAVLSKLNLEFLPGGFAEIVMGELVNVSDLSGKIESVMNGGLEKELSYIKDQMSPEALRSALNNGVEGAFKESLGMVSDLTRAQVEGLVGEYRGQFLNTVQAVSTYANSAKDYQSMMQGFVSDASKFTSDISNLGTKVDIADFVRGEGGIGSIVNTDAVIKEANSFVQNGIQNVVGITGYDIGVNIETNFANMNGDYLRSKLENMTKEATGVVTTADGTLKQASGRVPLFTKEQVDKIVADSNKAASASVAGYLTKTSEAVAQQAASVNAKLQSDLKGSVGRAQKIIGDAVKLEKHQDHLAQAMSNKVQEQVQTILGDGQKYLAVAGDTKPLSFVFPGEGKEDDAAKIAMIIAGARKKNNAVRANVKYWMVAKESADVVKNIRTKLQKYNPAAIDAKPEDTAWKDAARFQYYTLMLQNQQMKLLGAKAIAMAVNYAPYNEGLKKYIDKQGLPTGF